MQIPDDMDFETYQQQVAAEYEARSKAVIADYEAQLGEILQHTQAGEGRDRLVFQNRMDMHHALYRLAYDRQIDLARAARDFDLRRARRDEDARQAARRA